MELIITAAYDRAVSITGNAKRCQREELATISGPFNSIRWMGEAPSRAELRLVAGLLGPGGVLLLDCALAPDTYLDCLLVGLAKPQPDMRARYSTSKALASTTAVSLPRQQSIRSESGGHKDSQNGGEFATLEDEYVDEEGLLKEEDRIKPISATAGDCGTAEKRRACKDCTCGQAEAETQEQAQAQAQAQTKIDTSKAQSSCGNCYLGDAFRCGGCPYKGLPAFKPGEQIEIPTAFLADDVI